MLDGAGPQWPHPRRRGPALASLVALLGGLVAGSLAFASRTAVIADAAPPPSASLGERLAEAAIERTAHEVTYDGSYRSIPYPGGDVPDHVGVCTDVVIRAYRALGIDLQKDVHEEMTAHFEAFPPRWGLARPDPNIDHRRVPNLQVLFERRGESLPVTADAGSYAVGDLVTWRVAGRLPHIGIVTGRRSTDGQRPLIVHNIGRGPELDDMLFVHPITGHYRYGGSGR